MSYTTRIKEEIANIQNVKSEMIAELAGYIRNNGTIVNESITLTTENKKTVERICGFIKNIYNIDVKIDKKDNVNFSKKELIVMNINQNVMVILKDIGFVGESGDLLSTPPTYIVGANEEIRAYLRGVFLACGSINDPQTSRYHMELLISTPEEAVFVQKLLNIFSLNAKILMVELI